MAATLEVWMDGRRLRVSPKAAVGKGGEADVYAIDGERALKLFKPPDHPDLAMDPQAQRAAAARLEEHQRKLRAFPAGLPERAVAPERLAYRDPEGSWIVGYTMRLLRGAEPLLRYADRAFRAQGGIDGNAVVALFRDIHATLDALHRAGIVLGDFNDLNVLARPGSRAYFVDLDSAQFGPYLCRAFTTRFVDPVLCDPRAGVPVPVRPHTADSDWYAFAVMLMQCLLYTDPYGGVYRPKDPARRMAPAARPLRRITVFHPEVGYPKPALPWTALPDDLAGRLRRIFEQDARGVFPLVLLDGLRWTTCRACGAEHARPSCPFCFRAAPAALQSVTVARGAVTATRLFRTEGRILAAAVQGGRPRWLFHERGQFRREDGSIVLRGGLDPRLQFRLWGDATLIGMGGHVAVLRPGRAPERLSVDGGGLGPAFDTGEERLYWAHAGQLWRDGPVAPVRMGDVLAGQTFLRAGPSFGFGFYRAGGLTVAFVFDRERPGLNDAVRLPPVPGQLIEAACAFSRERCWLALAAQDAGRIVYRCVVLNARGEVEAAAQAAAGESAWLGPGLRGACARDRFLLVPSEEGVVRLDVDQGDIRQTKTFPDTEPFVHPAVRLLAGPDGLLVVDGQEIHLLKIA